MHLRYTYEAHQKFCAKYFEYSNTVGSVQRNNVRFLPGIATYKYMYILLSPWNKDTSLMRTNILLPMVSIVGCSSHSTVPKYNYLVLGCLLGCGSHVWRVDMSVIFVLVARQSSKEIHLPCWQEEWVTQNCGHVAMFGCVLRPSHCQVFKREHILSHEWHQYLPTCR